MAAKVARVKGSIQVRQAAGNNKYECQNGTKTTWRGRRECSCRWLRCYYCLVLVHPYRNVLFRRRSQWQQISRTGMIRSTAKPPRGLTIHHGQSSKRERSEQDCPRDGDASNLHVLHVVGTLTVRITHTHTCIAADSKQRNGELNFARLCIVWVASSLHLLRIIIDMFPSRRLDDEKCSP